MSGNRVYRDLLTVRLPAITFLCQFAALRAVTPLDILRRMKQAPPFAPSRRFLKSLKEGVGDPCESRCAASR